MEWWYGIINGGNHWQFWATVTHGGCENADAIETIEDFDIV